VAKEGSLEDLRPDTHVVEPAVVIRYVAGPDLSRFSPTSGSATEATDLI
jgi:hypothetical protein